MQSSRFPRSPVPQFPSSLNPHFFHLYILRENLWLKYSTYSSAPPFSSVMDEMQGGGLGVCFLHHHLLPASWNPKASHGARNEIFENTTYAAQTSFFFYKSVLSETRQVISLMQTAEIFCLKTHERVNECHFIDLTEDWFCRSSASSRCTFPGRSRASFPHGGRISGM